MEPIRDWHRIAVELLMTDVDLALQAVATLLAEDDREAVACGVRNTRSMYDSTLEKRKEVRLSENEASLLNKEMNRLKARLKFLGEIV